MNLNKKSCHFFLLLLVILMLVVGCSDSSENSKSKEPIIHSLQADKTELKAQETTEITVKAKDPDEEALSYTWKAEQGTIEGENKTIKYCAPDINKRSKDQVKVIVKDSDGKTVSGQVMINLVANEQEINSLLAESNSFSKGESTKFKVDISNAQNSDLNYRWQTERGQISENGEEITYSPPKIDKIKSSFNNRLWGGIDRVEVIAENEDGFQASKAAQISVRDYRNLSFKVIPMKEGNGYLIVGFDWAKRDSIVLKVDKDWNEEWSNYYNGLVIDDIKQTRDQGFILQEKGVLEEKSALIKLNKKGQQEWEREYDITETVKVKEGNNGYVLLANKEMVLDRWPGGEILTKTVDYVINLDSQGDIEWKKEAPNSINRFAKCYLTGDDKYIVISGGKFVKLDKSGEILQEKKYEDELSASFKLAEDNSDYLIFGAQKIRKIDDQGQVINSYEYDTGLEYEIENIKKMSETEFVADAGNVVFKVDQQGSIKWSKDLGFSVLEATPEGILLTDSEDVLKLDSSGTEVWRKTYEYLTSVTSTDENEVLIGQAEAIRKLNQDGGEEWQKKYDKIEFKVLK